MVYRKKNFILGQLENIEFVVILTRYQDKWVFCWHKKRKSYENPGGHVEKGETAMQAAKRELYEETGITDCEIIPLWDYEQPWDDGIHKNNGRFYLALVNSLGELPDNEMEKIELFDSVPENFTYDREDAIIDLQMALNILNAWEKH
jgi:8-oxo-dGTP diphosphatase